MAQRRLILAVPVGLMAVGTFLYDIGDFSDAKNAATKIAMPANDSAIENTGSAAEQPAEVAAGGTTKTMVRTSPAMPVAPDTETAIVVETPPLLARDSVSAISGAAKTDPEARVLKRTQPQDRATVTAIVEKPALEKVSARATIANSLDVPPTMAAVRSAIRERDFAKAVDLLSTDALGSDPEALYLLATLYRNGDGIERDDHRAFELMSMAAEKGHLEAEFSLARMYHSGRGVEADRTQAQVWMARAAEAGHVGATEALVLLMTEAIAVPSEVTEPADTAVIVASDIAGKQGKPPMIEAAERGEIRTLKRLLAAGEMPDIRDAEGRTALMLAARGGHKEAAELLVASGAEAEATDAAGKTALMHAAETGHADIAGLAALNVSELRDSGGHSAADLAFLNGHCSIGSSLFYDTSALDPAVEAAILEGCDAAGLRDLSEKGLSLADSDSRGRSAIWYAARAGNEDAVAFLINKGYTIESADELSPLLVAINGAHKGIAARLIAAGADIDAETSSGNTSLMIAATRGLPEVSEALIAAGADLNHRNGDGYSALMLAAKYGRTEIARILISHGANTSLRNVKRERAADIAGASGFDELAALFR